MTKIIAEIGINHNGIFQSAIDHIESAVEAGADYVKFHLAYSKNMVNLKEKRESWNDKHDKDIEPIDKFVERMEFTISQYAELKSITESLGCKFMVSVYDKEAAKDALSLGINEIKLASCDFVKEELINFIYPNIDHLYLATGMVSEAELEKAKTYIQSEKTTVMHCISLYPTPMKLANLNFIESLQKYGWQIGYSDHSKGIAVCVASLVYNPTIIEKHFMINENHNCPDMPVSCTPRELNELCTIAHNYKDIFGDGIRNISVEEFKNRNKFRDRWK